jgi:hypothetical protein
VLALWAEMNLVLADEFRDGNVPAHMRLLPVVQRAFQALPETVKEYYFRGDAGCWEKELVNWLRDPKRPERPAGKITFAISVRMTEKLKEHILRLPEESWQAYGEQDEEGELLREWAELWNYWPEEEDRPEGAGPLHYLVIRVRQRQRELFGDGSEAKYFAVASNQWSWRGQRLLEWHREKAGSIEALHGVLKNDLAAGVMPCGRFGANAAWLRLAVMTHNALTALKWIGLKPEWLTARPKRLRFHFFLSPGRFICHARRLVLRVVRSCEELQHWRQAWGLLAAPS